MELGMIGLGKMGGFMTERLVRGGHRVIATLPDRARSMAVRAVAVLVRMKLRHRIGQV